MNTKAKIKQKDKLRKQKFSFDSAIKGLGVAKKWNIELVKK